MANELTGEQQVEMQKLAVQEKEEDRKGNEAKTAWILWIVNGLITLAALIGVFVLLRSDATRVADAAYARGLITVLFSVGVVAMALIVVLTVLMQRIDPADPQTSEKKYQRAKEILALLLGILGTVVGFYFGTSTSENLQPATVTDVFVSGQFSTPGAEVELTALVNGGQPPISYRIVFEGLTIPEITGKTSEQRINEVFSMPGDIGGAQQLKVTVEIIDAGGTKSVLSKELTLTPEPAEEPVPPATNPAA